MMSGILVVYTRRVGHNFVGEIEWHLLRQMLREGAFAVLCKRVGEIDQMLSSDCIQPDVW